MDVLFSLSAFLDHKLISYRYTSCCCCSSSCWGDRPQKSLRLRRFKSDQDDQIGMKFGRNGLCIDSQLTSLFQDGGHDVISRRKMLLSGE